MTKEITSTILTNYVACELRTNAKKQRKNSFLSILIALRFLPRAWPIWYIIGLFVVIFFPGGTCPNKQTFGTRLWVFYLVMPQIMVLALTFCLFSPGKHADKTEYETSRLH